MSGIRVSVTFTTKNMISRRFWWYLKEDYQHRCKISDLLESILDDNGLCTEDANEYTIKLKSIIVPPSQTLLILRDGDHLDISESTQRCDLTRISSSGSKAGKIKNTSDSNKFMRNQVCGVGSLVSTLNQKTHQDHVAHSSLIEYKIDDHSSEYENYPVLTKLPKRKYTIAFRHLELGDNCSPQLSGYKVGRVVKRDKKTQAIKIELDRDYLSNNGEVMISDDIQEGCSIVGPSTNNILECTFKELVSPRIISKK